VESLRSFVALEVPAPAIEAIARVRRTLQAEPWCDDVRWVPDENLHVTLHFLGELPVERAPAIVDALHAAAASHSPFACSLSRVEAFPSARRARVIVVELSAADALAALARDIGEALTPLGFPPERRRFRPHVTLGRVRRPPLRDVVLEASVEGSPFEAQEMVLFRSELRPEGAHYAPIATIALG
jgi:2'-5' RNA ligase